MSLNPRFERIYCLPLRPIMTVPSNSQVKRIVSSFPTKCPMRISLLQAKEVNWKTIDKHTSRFVKS